MDSHHHSHLPTIHTLAGTVGGQQETKQHPMGQFQHQTASAAMQQPLVNTSGQNHQLLHFHHSPAPTQAGGQSQQQQQNSYSTLSHLNLSSQQQPHLNLMNHLSGGGGGGGNASGLFNSSTLHHPTSSQNSASSQATSLGGSSSTGAHNHLQHYFNTTNPHQHHLQHPHPHPHHQHPHHQHLQQQLLLNGSTSSQSSGAGQHPHQPHQIHHQQPGAYNMNSSDYSSSTYHVYDQILGDQIIDDLIVIKQERMKQKREQEQKIKVILFSLAVILLVGLLMFLIVKLFDVTNSATGGAGNGLQSSSLRIDTTSNQNNMNINNDMQQQPSYAPPFVYNKRPHWAPPIGGQTKSPNWEFDPNQMGQTVAQPPAPLPPSVLQPSQPSQQDQVQQHQQQQQAPINRYLPFVPPVMPPTPPTNLQRTHYPQLPLQPVVLPRDPSVPSASVPAQSDRVQVQPTFKRPIASPEASAGVALAPTPSDISSNHHNNNLRGCHGRRCPSAGCPNNCSAQGECVRHTATAGSSSSAPGQGADLHLLWQQQQQSHQAEWRCQCTPGFTGDDCSIAIERQCDDGLDNDRDGLVDCADSECCADPVCQNSTLCMKSPDPLDILMRKQPPPPTSSFFQRMQFLIEKMSSQFYSSPRDFNDSILAPASKYFDRASVLRGRVVYQKQGVLGVRVSVAGQRNLGIALTRDGGYFDLMVNGGGAVTVEFLREPFVTLHKTIRVPWNEIVLVDPIELQVVGREAPHSSSFGSADLDSEAAAPTCSAHNYRQLRPQIMAAPNSIRRSSASRPQAGATGQATSASAKSQAHQSRAVILRDSAMVQHSIGVPQSSGGGGGGPRNESVSLVYISSRASEFMSTINIQLTPNQVASQPDAAKLSDELKQIHLKIVIEGILFEQTFEPQLNLSFTYAWNRRNVYRQKSFGLSTAAVSVGYEYFDCKQIIWSTKQLQLPGHELAISDIGDSWNLNIHHRYNYRESILQRGDGQNFNLKTERPRVVVPLMGDGYTRQQVCPFCDGATSPSEQKLLRPTALVSAPDGSLYVGDHNLVRRIEPAPGAGSGPTSGGQSLAERAVRTVLELPPSRVSAKGYALALNLVAPGQEGPRLYMTDPERHLVYAVREQRSGSSATNDPTTSNETTPPTGANSAGLPSGTPPLAWEEALVPVAGNGQSCAPDDALSCGDRQSALAARLVEPKAMAFDLEGRMYLADGPNVRLVDTDQKIYTLLGDYSPARHHTKFPCGPGETVPMHKFVPKWPLDVALNPLDESLHVLDDNIVYRVTQDKRVQVVAGRPAHCARSSAPDAQQTVRSASSILQRASETPLHSARSIAFNQNGHLFVSEDGSGKQAARVLVVSPEDDTIAVFAGGATGASETPEHHQRLSNALSSASQPSATRASDFRFQSIAAIALDQRGHLVVADWAQLRVLSVEPDLPQLTAAGEYEIQSPEQPDELLVFNRHGQHVATRELSLAAATTTPGGLGLAQPPPPQLRPASNKYTFAYTVNTSFGQLLSVSYASGNKISILRDGHHHSVKAIETAHGGQCKLDVARNGQVHSIASQGPGGLASKTSLAYHPGGGLLKQSRDQATGETYDFVYDEFGRAQAIQHLSPQLPQAVECRVQQQQQQQQQLSQQQVAGNPFLSQHCASLIVAE